MQKVLMHLSLCQTLAVCLSQSDNESRVVSLNAYASYSEYRANRKTVAESYVRCACTV